jgi:GT2 family glycosyltransferase/tetratricopeptide (TPR) repeat protein
LGERESLPGQNNHLYRLLQAIRASLDEGDLDRAVRCMDRIWRVSPDSADTAYLYGRLLAMQGRYDLAVAPLDYAAKRRPDPDIEGWLVNALLAGGHRRLAVERLEPALRQFAAAPESNLLEASRRILNRGAGVAGWVGVAPTLELVGEIAANGVASRIELRTAEGELLLEHMAMANGSAPSAFRLQPPSGGQGRLEAFVDGARLLGSGFPYPPDFALDGRTLFEGAHISGWATLGWLPRQRLEFLIESDEGAKIGVESTEDIANPGRWRFALGAGEMAGGGRRLSISTKLPDGSLEALPDSPLLLDIDSFTEPKAPQRRRSRRHTGRGKTESNVAARRPVDVILPVYLGVEETLACLDSVLATAGKDNAIIVVDDASPEPALARALDELAAAGRITLLRNETNSGYAAAVNRALARNPEHDAVLLNADTIVFGDWIERLRTAAYSAPDIGTVTPFTNEGAIASYGGGERGEIARDVAARLDRLAAAGNAARTVDIPVGVGFCLYLRRDCLEETGLFDDVTFGKGYGEDNDLCLRATARGWRHVLAADVFVQHRGGRSFGSRRGALMERNRRLLNMRHPGYDALVERFIAADPIRPLRRRLDEERLLEASSRHVLVVTLALPGGVDRFVKERCARIRESGRVPLLLQPGTDDNAEVVLRAEGLPLEDLHYAVPDEIPALRALLLRLGIDEMELHHFLGHDARVIEIARELGVPYDIYIHDYVWICPRVTLLGGNGSYCGEPEITACETCIREHGGSLEESLLVADLRLRSGNWLAAARRVIAPTRDVATRLSRYFPAISPQIEPWEKLVSVGTRLPPRAGAIRIAVLGAIGEQKGYKVLLDCARDAASRDLPLEFVVIGYTEEDEPLFETGKVFVTGGYAEWEANELLRRERPHLAFFPAVAPETWCYTLTHALRAGLPVVAFDLGAVAERLRSIGVGTLLALGTSASAINDRLLQLSGAGDAATVERKAQPGAMPSAPAWVVPSDMPPLPREMVTNGNSDLMDGSNSRSALETTRGGPPAASIEDGLAASVQVINLPKGLYFFSVRAAQPAPVAEAGNLMLPAVHVTLGPGVLADEVTFLSGPQTAGTWLCEAGNTLIAKIAGESVTLVLTSVRGPSGQMLAIDIERLESRTEARLGGPAPQAEALLIRPNAPQFAPTAAGAAPMPNESARPDGGAFRLKVVAHVRRRGDMTFTDTAWAGRVGRGLWLEAFSVAPLEQIAGHDLEYKSLAGTGFETPWIGNGGSCGTRGMSTPLVGFAIRLKSTEGGVPYDCEYSGYFQSGTVAGPFRNGAPCRSTLPNDPLEGIQIRIVARSAEASTGVARSHAAGNDVMVVERERPVLGPRFSPLRDEGEAEERKSGAPSNNGVHHPGSLEEPIDVSGKTLSTAFGGLAQLLGKWARAKAPTTQDAAPAAAVPLPPERSDSGTGLEN